MTEVEMGISLAGCQLDWDKKRDYSEREQQYSQK